MKNGQALDRFVREIVIANQYLGLIYVLKADASNEFYHIALRPEDAPNMGLGFPSVEKGYEIV